MAAQELLQACEQGDLQTVRALVLNKKIDPNKIVEHNYYNSRISRSVGGWTPLHYAS